MSHFDWDMDDLLNFDYGKPVPDGRESVEEKTPQAADQQNRRAVEPSRKDEAQLYAEIRRKEQERALKEAQLREYMASAKRAEERSQRDQALREQAQREQAQREQAQREQAQREQVQREQAQREQAQREQAQREQALRESRAGYVINDEARTEDRGRLREALIQAQQAAAREKEEIDLRANRTADNPVRQQFTYGDSHRDEELRAQAQKAAYERYRAEHRQETSNGVKAVQNETQANKKASKIEKKSSKTQKKANREEQKTSKIAKKSKGAKLLSVLYLITAAVFTVSMLVMNVLPLKYLILLFVVLGLLSIIIVVQLTGGRIKKWARGVATFMSILLIIVYGVGTAYALGTLSFLGTTSVKNEASVGKITEDPFNVVMTGIDVSGTIDEQGRSDVNMIVTVNPQTSTVLMTSVPRDYEVRLPDKGYATDKLTHTGFYGVETTILAEEDLFDIESNYYVKVNFSTVRNFINAIGGVDVYSEYTFNPVKRQSWTVQEGMNHMNGDEALAFARERKAFATGDNQRIKNQQAVFEALIEKATSSKTMAISYGKILTELTDYFEMSFSSSEIRSLMKYQISKAPEWKIYKNTVSGPGASKATYSGGSQKLYVMEQDPTSVANAKALINAVLEGKQLQKDEYGNVSVVSAE